MTKPHIETDETEGGIQRERPGGGLLSIDRPLPFLLVYRAPPDRPDPGTSRLVTAEASYLISRAEDDSDAELVRTLAERGASRCNAFLVLEVWAAVDPASRRFTIRAPDGPAPETVGRLAEGLRGLEHLHPGIEVVTEHTDDRSPPGMPPLLSIEESWRGEILVLGLEVPPLHRDPATGALYPRFLSTFRRELSRVFRQTVYEFTRVQTSTRFFASHRELGTRSLPESVWEIDRELARIERSFDFLLMMSPVNEAAAWEAFRASGFDRAPDFRYRLLPVDPDLLKRRLFSLELEAVDDPAIAELFEDKRHELETLCTMLKERSTPAFRFSSHRLYGTVDAPLAGAAEEILERVRVPRRTSGETADAEDFRAAAERELGIYSAAGEDLRERIQVRRDITGLMVSEGVLMIGEGLRLERARVEPLIHHEVGTHVLTYVNGSAQPFEQLALGLAGYDELQEGLAVLAEYLSGGLTALRMRLLAARVVAARSVEEGADFVETFRMLRKRHRYSEAGAWSVATRVHASGGFTRDLIYLRGLIRLLELLRTGYPIEGLYVGKIAQKHVEVVEELRDRGVVRPPRLLPRILGDPAAIERLARIREEDLSLTDLISS